MTQFASFFLIMTARRGFASLATLSIPLMVPTAHYLEAALDKDWGEIFHNNTLAGALIDRLAITPRTSTSRESLIV